MKQRPRIYCSASQRALVRGRGQKGETLHQIARLLDDTGHRYSALWLRRGSMGLACGVQREER
jgi:hypothetical protein